MESKKSVITSSSGESGIEDFEWVENNKFKEEYKKNYLEYPLKKWKEIVYEQDLKDSKITDEGKYYKYTVNSILENDIFKDLEFHKEKKYIFDFNFEKYYNINYNSLIKGAIKPDFFVYKIPKGKFLEILNERKYMMLLRHKIPNDKKYISVVGEIKTSRIKAHKNDNQRQDYLTFINLANNLNKSSNSDEFLIMMYIYDISFSLFKNEENDYDEDKEAIIYGYIPKLYYEDCYKKYNEIIDLLKLSKEKIDLDNNVKLKPKISKRQLLNEKRQLLIEHKLLSDKIKFQKRILYSLIILIVAYIISKMCKLDLKILLNLDN